MLKQLESSIWAAWVCVWKKSPSVQTTWVSVKKKPSPVQMGWVSRSKNIFTHSSAWVSHSEKKNHPFERLESAIHKKFSSCFTGSLGKPFKRNFHPLKRLESVTQKNLYPCPRAWVIHSENSRSIQMATEHWTAKQHESKMNSLSIRLFSEWADAQVKMKAAIFFWPVRLFLIWGCPCVNKIPLWNQLTQTEN